MSIIVVIGLLGLSVLAVAVYSLHVFRNYWARRDLDRVYVVPFDGNMFNVERSVVARRATTPPLRKRLYVFPVIWKICGIKTSGKTGYQD